LNRSIQNGSKGISSLDTELRSTLSNIHALQAKLEESKKEGAKATHEVEYLKGIAADYAHELNELFAAEHRVDRAETFYQVRIQRQAFHMLKQATMISRATSDLQHRFNVTCNTKLVADSISKWHKQWMITKLKNKMHARIRKEYLLQWIKETEIKRIEHGVKDEHELSFKRLFFTKWKKCYKDSRIASRALRMGAKFRYHHLVPKYFTLWRDRLKQALQEQREEEKRVEHYKEILMMKRMLRGWRNVTAKQVETRKLIIERSNQRLLTSLFHIWKDETDQHALNRRNVEISEITDRFNTIRKFLFKWRDTYRETIQLRKLHQNGIKLHDQFMKQRYFVTWKTLFVTERYRKFVHAKAFDHYFTYLYRKHFDAWKRYIEYRREKRALNRVALNVRKSSLFTKWKSHWIYRQRLEALKATAIVKQKEMVKKMAARMLQAWRQRTQNELRLQVIADIFQTRWNRTIMRKYLCKWTSRLWKRTRKKIKNLSNESRMLRDNVHDKSGRIANFGRENVQTMQHVHEMTADLAQYRLRLDEKDDQTGKLRSEIEEARMVERALRDEIDTLRENTATKDQEMETLKQQIDQQDNEIKQRSTDLRRVEELSTSMIQDANGKQDALVRAEQVVKSMEASYNDAQTRLASALDIITSLRTLMEEKDKKHELELKRLQEQANYQKKSYEMDLLHDDTPTYSKVQPQHDYVRFEEEHGMNGKPRIPNIRAKFRTPPSPSITNSSVDSSLLSGKSMELDDEINRLQSQIMQRLSSRDIKNFT
jgi:hypothetical protein